MYQTQNSKTTSTPPVNALVTTTMANVFHPHNECGSNRSASSLTLGGGKPPSPAVSAHFSGKSTAEEDGFYQKLNKLNESSGLSLM